MRASLRRLLDHPIDYAGLFPPAEHPMKTAVAEYLAVIDGPEQWIVDKFVCPATRLEELTQELKGATTGALSVTVIGTQHADGPAAAVAHDSRAIELAHATGTISIDALEVRIDPEQVSAGVAAARKLHSLVGDEDTDVYLEVGWGETMVDAMHESVGLFEQCGFKARTGGVTASAFPSSELFATFLSECAALECGFKFTAGLHEPVRYFDDALGVYRHGFLNAMLAGALAMSGDLNRRELEEVLNIDSAAEFAFGVDDIRVGGHWLEAEDIDPFWAAFGGFGSCSVQEPIEGLRRLGWLDEVEA